MSTKINVTPKQLITDPESFYNIISGANGYDSAITHAVKKFSSEKTEEWKARGDNDTIRSSSFARCLRQAGYGYIMNNVPQGEFDDVSQERMYMGLIGETLFEQFLDDIEGITHEEQNIPPIHLEHPSSTEKRKKVATTDFVKELDYGGTKYFIPMELKNKAEMYHWNKFRGSEEHKRQLATWIYIAKALGMNVPYGMLVYVHNFFKWRERSDIKIVFFAVDTPFRKMGRNIESWSNWQWIIEGRYKQLDDMIDRGILPPVDQDIPKVQRKSSYICGDCPFFDYCKDERMPTRLEVAAETTLQEVPNEPDTDNGTETNS